MAKPKKKPASLVEVPALVAALVPIDSVKPDPDNVREHNTRSLDGIAASLKEFGQQKPIIVDRDNVIRAGNGTWLAAKRLKWSSINVIHTKLDAKQAARYAISDNRTSELSYFDDAALASALQGMGTDELAALGFDAAEAQELLDAQADPMEEIDAQEKKNKSQGNGGQIAVRLMVAVKNVDIVEDALSATGEMNRETALLAICQAYLDSNGAGQFNDRG